MPYNFNNKIIITGAPGAGKSTLLDALKQAGYHCHEEISRIVIKESLSAGNDILPWKNVDLFSQKVLEKMLIQYSKETSTDFVFCDRAIPDIMAYLLFGKKNIAPIFFEELNKVKYHPTVFIAPPWQEIYVNDNERIESFEIAQQIYNCLNQFYREINFNLVELPKVSVNKRVEFILANISTNKNLFG